MPKNNSITKAERATIKLGDIELDVFQLPDGSYLYGYDWITQVIGKDKKLLSNKRSNYYVLKLCKLDVAGEILNPTVRVKGIKKPYNAITDKQLMIALSTLVDLGTIMFCRSLQPVRSKP